MSLIEFPIIYIPDPTKDRPLFSGQVFVGEPDLDPEIPVNQKQLNVIEEDGTVVPVPQPFVLSAGGVPVYNGNPVRLDVDGNYSIKILSNLGAQIYYIENVASSDSTFFITSKISVAVVQDETIYEYPENVTNVSSVMVSGKVIFESAGQYVNDPVARTITIPGGLASEEIMEWWTSAIPAPDNESNTAKSLDFASSAGSASLAGVDIVATVDGVLLDDNFGGVFASTGLTNVPKAGTIDVGLASIYDINGLEFKSVSEKIRLEAMGVPYTETSETVLGYIIALRGNGFSVDVSPRYSLTTFAGQNLVHRGQKEFIIHRGMAKLAPENTLCAWSMAWNRTNGLNVGLEVDVQISSDGVPVCFHNTLVDLTTDGAGDVKDLTFAQLRALKFNETIGTAFEDGVRIPSFDDFLEYASSVGAKIYPEIKGYRTIDDIELINNVVRKYRYENFTTFSAFPIENIEKLREYNQQSAWAWATNAGVYTQSDINRLVAVGGHGNVWQSLNEWTTNPSDIDVFHSYGWDVGAYTATRIEHIQDMAAIGIQKINCDINPMPSASLSAVNTQRRFNLNPWSQITSGAGSVVYSANPQNAQSAGEIVACEAGVSEDARVRLPFSVAAGETMAMLVFARNVGGHDSNCQIDIDYPVDVRVETLNIISDDYIEYQVSIQAPFNEDFAAYQGAFILGSSFSRDSGAEFYRPIIRSSDSMYGASKNIMGGMVIIASGGVSGVNILNTEVNNFGVDTVTANGSNIQIRPQNEIDASDAGLGKFTAKVQITPTGTGQSTLPLVFFADAQGSTGTVNIGAINSTTGAIVNLNAITSEHKIYFTVEL